VSQGNADTDELKGLGDLLSASLDASTRIASAWGRSDAKELRELEDDRAATQYQIAHRGTGYTGAGGKKNYGTIAGVNLDELDAKLERLNQEISALEQRRDTLLSQPSNPSPTPPGSPPVIQSQPGGQSPVGPSTTPPNVPIPATSVPPATNPPTGPVPQSTPPVPPLAPPPINPPPGAPPPPPAGGPPTGPVPQSTMDALLQLSLNVGAIGTFAYLSKQAISGAANFAGGKENAGVIGSMENTTTGAVTDIGAGAMAGFRLSGGNPVGALIGGLVGAGASIAKLPTAIMDWTESLLKSQQGIAQWNGMLVAYFGEAERRGILRDIKSGEATGASTAAVGNQYQLLLDELRPIRNSITNLLLEGLGPLIESLRALTWLFKATPQGALLKLLGEIAQNTKKEGIQKTTVFDALMDGMRKPIPPNSVPKRP
jgi:hypothetical protein